MILKVLAGTALGCALIKTIKADEKNSKGELLVTGALGLISVGVLSTVGDEKAREFLSGCIKKIK